MLCAALGACRTAPPPPPPQPETPAQQLADADRALARGDTAAARAHLERVLELERHRFDVHQRIADLTGRAPGDALETEAASALAEAHPYDPHVRLAAARAARAGGDEVAAREHLDWAIFLADLDPAAARAASQELAALDPAWNERVRVPVHLFADQTLRADPGWRFRLRFLLRSASHGLDPALGVAFVPVSIGGFDAPAAGGDLDAILAAFEATPAARAAAGLVLLFTEQRPPPTRVIELGRAEFVGRRAIVRLRPGEAESRTLAHEILHLYGAVHVSDRIDSIMNPAGGSLLIDPLNARIVRALRRRHFGPGGLEANVLPVIDLEETTEAYLVALRTNLLLRQAGIDEALREARTPRARAYRMQRDLQLDPHLGDVCLFAAQLLWRGERRVEATALYDAAAQLYGPRTARGMEAAQRAEELRRLLADLYDSP